MSYIIYILVAIAILLMMIVIHEFGHYVAGKLLKFKINEFSIGFGPKLLQKKLKNGEKFTLRAIPLGGYCAFEDEDGISDNKDNSKELSLKENDNSNIQNNLVATEQTAITNTKSKSFVLEKPWKRLIVFVAGAGFNFISAIIFSFIFILAIGGSTPTVATRMQSPITKISNGITVVSLDDKKQELDTKGYYASELKEGDVIIKIGDKKLGPTFGSVTIFTDYQKAVDRALKRTDSDEYGKKIIDFLVKRDGKEENVKVVYQTIFYAVTFTDGTYLKVDEDGNPVLDNDGYYTVYKKSDGGELLVTVKGGKFYDKKGDNVTGELLNSMNGDPAPNNSITNYEGFGFSTGYASHGNNLVDGLKYSIPLTLKFSWMIIDSFIQMFSGKVSVKEMTGPVSTIGVMAKVATENALNLLILMPLIAANLAIFNLLPIPALDGSKVVFTLIEWIRGKPINRKIENTIHFVGIILLFGFVILIEILRLVLK